MPQLAHEWVLPLSSSHRGVEVAGRIPVTVLDFFSENQEEFFRYTGTNHEEGRAEIFSTVFIIIMEIRPKSSPSRPPRSNSFTGSTAPIVTHATPPAVKPSSRARAYRIPNTDAAGDAGKGAVGGAGGDSFLWGE